MKPDARRRGITALLLCLPMLSAGCGGLLGKAPERQLYRLNPNVALTQAPPRVGALLVIATPTASAGLDTNRIALIRSPVAIDYYADGEWIDRPPFLVKQALIEGFQKSGAFAGGRQRGARSQRRLRPEHQHPRLHRDLRFAGWPAARSGSHRRRADHDAGPQHRRRDLHYPRGAGGGG